MDFQIENILNKIRHNTSNIGEHFFIDYKDEKAGKEIPYWNVAMMTFAYALKKNLMLIGEPGFGKTTAAKVLGTVYGGYPFDLFESAQFQGHPEQTIESLVGRLDFSKLSNEEKVIWQMGIYLPMVLIDEINKLPSGKQKVMLNNIATGRFSYLNDTFFDGKKPFFATANHPDDNNDIIIPAMTDRFSICLEIGDQGPFAEAKIEAAVLNIAECLVDNNLTGSILKIINSTKMDVSQKLKKMDEKRKPFLENLVKKAEMQYVSAKEMQTLKHAIETMPLSEEAKVFLNCTQTELNYGGKYGRKRSCDALDSSDHMRSIASSKVNNAFSPRGSNDSIKRFAQAVALYSGSEKVEKVHLIAIAPYALQHRLDFTDDFRADNEDVVQYGEDEIYFNAPTTNGFLAMKLIEGVNANYMKSVQNQVALVSKLLAEKELNPKEKKKAQAMLDCKLSELDHPLLKCLAYEWKRRR